MLKNLKIDRQLFKQLETNKEMKDQGLDFLMKHFVDTQAPHMKNYKSLADIDQTILELEMLVKNKMLKELKGKDVVLKSLGGPQFKKNEFENFVNKELIPTINANTTRQNKRSNK